MAGCANSRPVAIASVARASRPARLASRALSSRPCREVARNRYNRFDRARSPGNGAAARQREARLLAGSVHLELKPMGFGNETLVLAALALLAGVLVNLAVELLTATWSLRLASTPSRSHPAARTRPLGPRRRPSTTLAAGKLPIVDLWPGRSTPRAPIGRATTTSRSSCTRLPRWKKMACCQRPFRSPEHLGTHLDAPNHFERNQPRSIDRGRAAFRAGSGDRRLGGGQRGRRLPPQPRRRAPFRGRPRPDSQRRRGPGLHRLEQVLEQSRRATKIRT